MKAISYLVLAALVVLLAGVAPAEAHRRTHLWVGPVFGPTLWWAPPAYYAPPRTVVIERTPEMYVQSAPDQERPAYWYFCKDAKAYYPYVKQCPGGWSKVAPVPPEEGE